MTSSAAEEGLSGVERRCISSLAPALPREKKFRRQSKDTFLGSGMR